MNGSSEAKAMTAANWIALVVAASIIIGAFWVLITSQIESKVKPLEEKVYSLGQEKDELRRSIASIEDEHAKTLALISADHAERLANEREIETQFRASDEARNVQFATQQRVDALLWEKIFSNRYPSDVTYFPHIAK